MAAVVIALFLFSRLFLVGSHMAHRSSFLPPHIVTAATSKRKRGDEDTVEDQVEDDDDPFQELRKRRASIIVGIAEG